ncbi:hypothetical protein [Flavobacterium silvaticum]|uniref:Uncharacterized protein n=1 Tax=Flavobacterium silvaticum TaxID=1852020 RepID=A0A972FUR4_9FLAO|nr:hypothetical protein [Flavobacterium silvaticum]NMH27980.1 hypothetical protein [Flavobacterium silvaticum]
MQKKPDTTVPGIDRQDHGFIRKAAHSTDESHEQQMREAVKHDREFYDDPKNPGKEFNVNDQAYSQSSPEDFVRTNSKFKHSDDYVENLNPDN